MTRVTAERAVVLHTRPYRETSMIANILTERHGRIAAVVRGARGARKASSLQPFNQLVAGWSGRGSLMTLTSFEAISHPVLKGDQMAAAFYVAELVMRLLAEHEIAPRIFTAVVWSLDSLEAGDLSTEVVLRSFEKLLLEDLGYGIEFGQRADSLKSIDPQARYELIPEQGFVAAAEGKEGYSGADLLAIADDDYSAASTRRSAKKIFRGLLNAQLGARPLLSRSLLLRGSRE